MKKVLVTFMVALFATMVLGQTKTEIKSGDLPKCVKEYLIQKMKGFNIDKAFKVDNKGEITYIVTVTKGKEKRTLEFDKNCKNVKNFTTAEPKKPEAVTPTPPKPVPLPPVNTGKETTPKK
jgi:hypothetical protein